jgi:hypothetical protein
MITNDAGTYESLSEEEMKALDHVAMHCQVNADEDAPVFCGNDPSSALIVFIVLTLKQQQDEDQH